MTIGIGRDKSHEPAPPTVKADSSSALAALLALIPDGDQYKTLRFTLMRIAETFPTELKEIGSARVQGWIDEIASGDGRTATEIRNDIFKYVVGEDLIMSTLGVDADTAQKLIAGTTTFSSMVSSDGTVTAPPSDSDPGDTPTGATDQFPGIMAGGEIIQVERDGLPDIFIAAYEYPPGSGKFISWQFDSEEQIAQILGDTWFKDFGFSKRSEQWYRDNSMGNESIADITGLSGDFLQLMNQAGYEAAAAAGINDPTLIGQMLSDPEMQQIMAQAVFGGWTDEQVMAAKRDTDFWKNTLYPGIEKFYGKTANPEQAWATYASSVESSLIELGYRRDADGTFKTVIGELIFGNVEVQSFKDMVPTFVKAQQNPEFFDALDRWSNQMLGKDLEFDDWFSILDGTAPPELASLAEAATLSYTAAQRGSTITDAQIERLTSIDDLSEADAQQLFSEFDSALTALGERGLDRYGLTKDEILSLAGGIKPDSGRSLEVIRNKAGQAMREEGLLDDKKISFFVGYDSAKGTPIRPGLNPLAPEVA